MRKVESTVSLPKITVKELIDALKTLNPDTPLQNFVLHKYRPTGTINIYDFAFTLPEYKKS